MRIGLHNPTRQSTDDTNHNTNVQHLELPNDEKDADWLDTNQLLDGISITSLNTKERNVPILSALTLKKKRKNVFTPLDFTNFSMDVLIDSRALVYCLPESEFDKIKSINPTTYSKGRSPQYLNFRSLMAT